MNGGGAGAWSRRNGATRGWGDTAMLRGRVGGAGAKGAGAL